MKTLRIDHLGCEPYCRYCVLTHLHYAMQRSTQAQSKNVKALVGGRSSMVLAAFPIRNSVIIHEARKSRPLSGRSADHPRRRRGHFGLKA